MGKNSVCMNCGSSDLHRFLDLGRQPNGNYFPMPEEKEQEPWFSFAMLVCKKCWQVQIEEFPSPEFMFSNHPYITGVNMPVVDHFYGLVKRCIERYELKPKDWVLDIGCNDGTLLTIFEEQGLNIVGMDPGKSTGKLAREAGVKLIEEFWTEESACRFRQENPTPRIITATSMFYHLQDIHDFIRGLKEVMTEETVFVTQCVYLKDILQKDQFDHFYHEHTMIHALAPLKSLFEHHGMRLLHVDYYDVHGGSFVLDVALNESSYVTDDSIEKAIEEEKKLGLQCLETYTAFSQRIEKKREQMRELLLRLKGEGKVIDALGAPLKGSTLMNYCGIGPEWIRCAVEVNPFKKGKLTPGTHIPIVDEKGDYQTQTPPDYYLVLAWNFLEFFQEKYRDYLEAGGYFIVPHPEVHCIGKE